MNVVEKLLKLLFEKDFIKTLLSFVLAVVVFCITPNDFIMIDKLTNVGYFLFLVVASFLVVEIIYRILKVLDKIRKRVSDAFRYAMAQERKTKKLWKILDKADDDEREIIIKLLETENEPIPSMFGMHFTPCISDWIEEKCDYYTHFYYYWLNDEVYQLLKPSLNSYIKKCRKKTTNEAVSK